MIFINQNTIQTTPSENERMEALCIKAANIKKEIKPDLRHSCWENTLSQWNGLAKKVKPESY